MALILANLHFLGLNDFDADHFYWHVFLPGELIGEVITQSLHS